VALDVCRRLKTAGIDKVRLVAWPTDKPKGYDLTDELRDFGSEAARKVLDGAELIVDPGTPSQPDSSFGAKPGEQGRAKTGTAWEPQLLRSLDDIGNAERIFDRFGHEIRFAPEMGFVVFDGIRWICNADLAARERAQITLRDLWREAKFVDSGDETQQKLFTQHRRRSTRTNGISNALTELKPHVLTSVDAFDPDPMLLNVQNGTVDLQTGILRPHDRRDLITKVCPVHFDPEAQCPLWEETLALVFAGNRDLIQFVQRAVGYSITGHAFEHVLFFAWGTGRNGKSTILETIRAMLGDYAEAAQFKSFLARDSDTVRNDIADLRGARFIPAIEAGAEGRLDEALVKSLTGGDTIKARHLFKEHFSFQMTGKIWLAANHKPTIRGSDPGIWSRVLLVPFDVFIPPERRVKDMPAKLQAELPGILRWAVEGCLDWQRNGLNPPEAVVAATEDYRDEMDLLSGFLDECCVIHSELRVPFARLYRAYKSWCGESGDRPMKPRTFAMRLQEKGFEKSRVTTGNRQREYRGLGLSATGEGKVLAWDD
jgi:putative DNA primase/helicase